MTEDRRIVCLANSRKLAGRCIAGREWRGDREVGSWIRPVSDRKGQEVSWDERRYEDGRDPQPLDIVDVPVVGRRPEDFQAENWLLDPQRYWRKRGTYPPLDLPALVDPPQPLWIDGHSTYNGTNDRIPLEAARALSSSLRLVRVERLELAVFSPGEAFGNSKRRVQGRFSHAGAEYRLWVTDPAYERAWLAKLDGVYDVGACYLTISLGERYGGFCYKLVAAVFADEGRRGR